MARQQRRRDVDVNSIMIHLFPHLERSMAVWVIPSSGGKQRGVPAMDNYLSLQLQADSAAPHDVCMLGGKKWSVSAGKKFTELKGLNWQGRKEHIMHYAQVEQSKVPDCKIMSLQRYRIIFKYRFLNSLCSFA